MSSPVKGFPVKKRRVVGSTKRIKVCVEAKGLSLASEKLVGIVCQLSVTGLRA